MTKTESKIPPKPKDYPFNDYCWQNDQKVPQFGISHLLNVSFIDLV